MPPFFHPNALQSGISILQTPECLHGRQLPGSGPLPLRVSFLLSGPRLQILGGTVFITQSYSPLSGQGLCPAHLSAKGQATKNRLWGK